MLDDHALTLIPYKGDQPDGEPRAMPGASVRIEWQKEIKQVAAAGNTSQTGTLYKGWSPALIRIQGTISMQNMPEDPAGGGEQSLSALHQLFDDRDPNHSDMPRLWQLQHAALNAAGIRYARFGQQMNVDRDESLLVWHYTVRMTQVKGRPAEIEQRLQQQSAPVTSNPSSPNPTNNAENAQPLTQPEIPAALKWLEQQLSNSPFFKKE